MKSVTNFIRTEKKYVLSKDQHDSLLTLSKEYLVEDEFNKVTVNNIYFDNDDDFLIRHSISKPDYKEKLRLRGYNNLDQLYLEIKKKYNKVVYKRRIPITFEEVDNSYHVNGKIEQIGKEINFLMEKYHPKPKYYISYIRSAYRCIDDKDLRITFDRDITYRLHDLDLRKGRYGESLLNKDECIMEIKTSKSIPLWLVTILNDLRIYPTSYSKVGNIYKKEFMKTKESNYELSRKHLHQ